MPKIRDLGINVIPVTMRPPEIGPGGGYEMQDTGTCVNETICNQETCNPSGQCVPSCDRASVEKGYEAHGFGYEAIAQLKQQLQNRIDQQY
jgi:hypothetical protein